jgi:hypothetical protein
VKYDLLLEGRTLKPQSLFQNKAVDLESNNWMIHVHVFRPFNGDVLTE